MRLWTILPVLTAGLCALAAELASQEPGWLAGRVVEAGTGTPVEGVLIRADGPIDASAVSDRDGGWRVGPLPAGEYRLSAERIGFASASVVARVPSDGDALTLTLTGQALPLDALVVTASRRMQRLADAPVTTELITRRDIERSGASDLSTVLAEGAGIQLQGGHPAGEGVMLQGLGSERVMVLVDGQPMVGRISGQIDLSRIPTSMVERVEVVKGPQSSLYGSEAMGGVVNIITRGAAPEPWSLALDATAGSQGRADASGTLRGTVGAAEYLVNGGRRMTELTPGRAGEQGALARRWDGLGKLAWVPGPSLRVDGSLLVVDERQRWQAGQLYTFADNRQATARVGGAWTGGPHSFAPALYVTGFDHRSRQAMAPEPVPGSGDREVQRLWEAEALYNLELGLHALDLGVEAKREETVSDRVRGRERALHTVEPFLQATLVRGPVSVVPGARVSWSDLWGTHVTPRLSALYRPLPELALRASAGRGFRAPGFKELYMQFLNVGPGYGYTVRGNPDLRPETSTNVAAGVEWAPGAAYVRAQIFRNDFDGFIETGLAGDSSGVTVYTYGNVARGYTRGLELEGGLTLGALRAEGGYAWLEARDAEADRVLLGRPTHAARLTVEHALPAGLRPALTASWTGATPVQRTEEEVIHRTGFLRLDLRLARTLPGGLELSLGARNLLDAAPEHWPGFSGRHLHLGLGWSAADRGGRAPRP